MVLLAPLASSRWSFFSRPNLLTPLLFTSNQLRPNQSDHARALQGGGAFCENRADSKLEAEELSDAPLLQPSFTVSHVIALPPPPAAPPPSETDEADPRGGKKRPVEGRGAGVSYLVRLPDEAGRLDAAKAAELGPLPLLVCSVHRSLSLDLARSLVCSSYSLCSRACSLANSLTHIAPAILSRTRTSYRSSALGRGAAEEQPLAQEEEQQDARNQRHCMCLHIHCSLCSQTQCSSCLQTHPLLIVLASTFVQRPRP
eukprot:22352-Rhodomonas_salina.1